MLHSWKFLTLWFYVKLITANSKRQKKYYFSRGSECWICRISALKNGKRSPNSNSQTEFGGTLISRKNPGWKTFLFFHTVFSDPFVMGTYVWEIAVWCTNLDQVNSMSWHQIRYKIEAFTWNGMESFYKIWLCQQQSNYHQGH